jgi:hypothetical protein
MLLPSVFLSIADSNSRHRFTKATTSLTKGFLHSNVSWTSRTARQHLRVWTSSQNSVVIFQRPSKTKIPRPARPLSSQDQRQLGTWETLAGKVDEMAFTGPLVLLGSALRGF